MQSLIENTNNDYNYNKVIQIVHVYTVIQT